LGLGYLVKMNKNDNTQSSKQTLQDVLMGEEPTEELLEELLVLEESEEISENELAKLALATQTDNIDDKVKLVEPNYKTSETNIFGILLIVAIILAAIYFLFIS
jgi:hypothetical protein